MMWVLAMIAGANPYLDEARVFYRQLEFEQCLRRLERAGSENNSREELVAIELYRGLCHAELGDARDAAFHFETACMLDPACQLPEKVSPKIAADFQRATERAAKVAGKPTMTAARPTPASRAGLAMIVAGGVALVAGVVFGALALSSSNELTRAIQMGDPALALRGTTRTWGIMADVLLPVGAVCGALGLFFVLW
jgi:hypothetical protein